MWWQHRDVAMAPGTDEPSCRKPSALKCSPLTVSAKTRTMSFTHHSKGIQKEWLKLKFVAWPETTAMETTGLNC